MSERAVRLFSVLLAMTATACSVGPDFRPPDATLPPAWASPLQAGLEALPEMDARWWEQFHDPKLEDLLSRAVAGNTDVAEALARIRAARAVRGGALAGFFPQLDSVDEYSRRQVSGATGSLPVLSSSREFDNWGAGFDSTWEIDVFGGQRRAYEKASAEVDAAGADLHAALVSVLGEVARNYVEMRSLQARIAIAQQNAASQLETLDLVRWRHDAGLAGALDVEQATYNRDETRSRVPALEIQLAAARHRIAVLLGLEAGALDTELAEARPLPPVPASLSVGIPADLLRRRPDVVAAEKRLAAATAAIGVATADLYPKLSLSGSFSVSASDITSLDAVAARGFSIGPTLRWNLFDAGRLRSVVNVRSAEADAAVAAWESTVLTASEEVENALVGFVREQQRRELLASARDAAKRALGLARLQYENGLVDFQRVLEAQRSVFVYEESLAVCEASVRTNAVAIYKALGGGWQDVRCGDSACAAPAGSAAPREADTGKP